MADRPTPRDSRRRRAAGADEATEAARLRLERVRAVSAWPDTDPVGDPPWDGPWDPPPDELAHVAAREQEQIEGGSGGPRRPVRRLLDRLADRMPVALRGAVVAASGRAVAALAVVLAAAVGLGAGLVWLTRPQEAPVPPVHVNTGSVAAVGSGAGSPAAAFAGPSQTPSADGLPSAGGSAIPTTGVVVVHVAGAVHRPGLVTLPAGSRVADAVQAAGGATARAALVSVNLARLLVDGEQLVVLRHGQAAAPPPGLPAAGSGGTGSSGAPGATLPVDLNSATLEQLDGLPGIGPVLAQRILDWRTAHGRFGSVDELSEVSGIGERTLADLRPEVRV